MALARGPQRRRASPRGSPTLAKNIQVCLSTGRSSSAGCVVIIPITPAPAISSQAACSRAARQPPPDNPRHAIGPDTKSRRDCRYRAHATRAPQEVALPPPPAAAATPRSAARSQATKRPPRQPHRCASSATPSAARAARRRCQSRVARARQHSSGPTQSLEMPRYRNTPFVCHAKTQTRLYPEVDKPVRLAFRHSRSLADLRRSLCQSARKRSRRQRALRSDPMITQRLASGWPTLSEQTRIFYPFCTHLS